MMTGLSCPHSRRRRTLRVLAGALVLALASGAPAAEPGPPKEEPRPKKEEEAKPEPGSGRLPRPAPTQPGTPPGAPAEGTRDPFSYSLGTGSEPADPYVAVKGARVPKGIRVLGVLSVADGPRIAVLSIPSQRNTFFVREKDAIRLEPEEKDEAAPILYLEVRRIGTQEIEVFQKTRPDQVIILR
jgi:hypothetical protein